MKPKKRLFIGLISGSLILVISLGVLIWFLAINRENAVYQLMLVGTLIVLLGVVSIIGVGIFGMVLTIWQSKTIPSMQAHMRMATNLLFPVALIIGKLLGIDRDLIKRSFIEVNNEMVYTKEVAVLPEQVMILIPHCLQKSTCPHKITLDIANCQRCGQCSVHHLRELSDRYGVSLVMASGGTLARKFIEKYRPRAIVAIACERDLTSGIQDVNPLPVLGVLNIRPEGPCFNTTVSLPSVEEGIKYFLAKCPSSWETKTKFREVES